MKAIILSAGQGRRLLPWTHDLPKCLLPFAGRTLLAWQLETLAAAGIAEAVVVTGFAAPAVEREIAVSRPPGLKVESVRNPFFGVADNIASVWLVRELLVGDVMILNGDTLFGPDVVERLLARMSRPITLALASKPAYDADDVKVVLDGERPVRIGKQLSSGTAGAEYIGLLACRGLGGALLGDAVEKLIARPGGARRWYFTAVDALAAKGFVGGASIAGMRWTEVDYPGDLGRAEMLARQWLHERKPARLPCPVVR